MDKGHKKMIHKEDKSNQEANRREWKFSKNKIPFSVFNFIYRKHDRR